MVLPFENENENEYTLIEQSGNVWHMRMCRHSYLQVPYQAQGYQYSQYGHGRTTFSAEFLFS